MNSFTAPQITPSLIKKNKTEKTFQSKPPDKERLIFELSKKEMTFMKEKNRQKHFLLFWTM